MAVHYTTFVLPGSASDLPDDTPFLVIGVDTDVEIPELPWITSLHRVGNAVTPFVHATPVLGDVPVTDRWADAVTRYGDLAKVVVLLEMVPGDISTEYATVAAGVTGEDLPPWLGAMLAGQIRCATRDVLVSSGAHLTSVCIDPAAPTTFPEWAQQIITSGSGDGEPR